MPIRTVSIFLAAALMLGCAQTHDGEGHKTQKSIRVSGEGSVNIEPNMAFINLGIQIKNAELTAAQQRVAAVADSFLKLSDELGIEERHIQTTAANVRPEYRWNPDTNEQELIGYLAERRLRVELNDLNNLGALIEGAIAAGINQVSPPTLSSSNAREAYREALGLAASDARRNALVLAGALDVGIDKIISINAVSDNTGLRPTLRSSVAAANDTSASAGYGAGEITYTANVVAVFGVNDD
ncbi:MAG: SIMPL domain-containing protein [Gammaproteobacteria bacterium]|nr:SIMPL domain-containing protein [Gammaproteobacteria bacterium]